MSRPRARPQAVIGCRVKSGRATAVLLVGPAHAPLVADARVIALSDPAVPTSRQPYHAVRAASAAAAPRVERSLRRIVERTSQKSLSALVAEYRRQGYAVRRVALVVGSLGDPTKIANDHIRAHALEGQLFRTALERAARAGRLRCAATRERDLYAEATAALRRGEGQLKRALVELGRGRGGPWRAEEKTATLAAWIALRNAAH